MNFVNIGIDGTESIGSNFVHFFACIITKTKDRSAVHIILTHLNGELSTGMNNFSYLPARVRNLF